MLDRFGEREVIALTDRDNTGVVDTLVLANALNSADDEINTYFAGGYSLPLASTPVIVRDFACDIARYRLSTGEVVETDEVRNRYKDAIKFFEKVATGLITLGLDLTNKTTAMIGSVKSNQNHRVFNAAKLADY